MSLIMNLNLQQRKRLHQITLVATFGGLLFGYDTGVINGAFSSLKQYMALTPTTEGLVMSVLLIGAMFVGVMQGTMGFITWVVLAELFPLKFRGLSMGISVFFMWVMNAIVSYLFPLLQAKLGLGPVFLIFAAINYLAIVFVIAALPETSNKSLEQLEEELSANKSAAGFNTATKENGL